MIELDIVNEKQLEAMAVFAETKLVNNLEEEHNVSLFRFNIYLENYLYFFQSTEVIFDAILPEWTLAAFCKKFKLARREAIEKIKLQSKYLIEMNDSD